MENKSMSRRELIDLCLAWPDAWEDYPFDELPGSPGSWAVMRHRGNRKGFAFIFEREGLCVNLKCEPVHADFLRGLYPGAVLPAYHMNKAHWNSVYPQKLPDGVLEDLLAHSYRLTMPRVGRRAE